MRRQTGNGLNRDKPEVQPDTNGKRLVVSYRPMGMAMTVIMFMSMSMIMTAFMPVVVMSAHQISFIARKLAMPFLETIIWSCTTIPIALAVSTTLFVIWISSVLGVVSPLG